jgi:hypothetical protein
MENRKATEVTETQSSMMRDERQTMNSFITHRNIYPFFLSSSVISVFSVAAFLL